jgi:short-chain fatty acids transporter
MILTQWSTCWVPDSYIIAVFLTLFTFALGLLFTPSTPYQLIQYWGNGFWELLSFAMQMCLIIMTGYVLAVSKPFSRGLDWLAGVPKSPQGAVALMAFVSMVTAWINWGLSIVGSAVFVRFMVRRQRGVDYRLLVCCAYLGLGIMWHSGLSASAPLLVATPKHFMEKDLGLIPVTETVFHPFNLGLAFVILIVFTLLAPLMHPRRESIVEVDPLLLKEEREYPIKPDTRAMTPAVWIEHSPLVNLIVGLAGIIWLVWWLGDKGFNGININVVNFIFLMLGVLLHWTPASFLKAAEEGGRFIWGVVVQFPFYAGIFGIIKFSALQDVLANWFTSIATAKTYPFLIVWYSGILNYIIPSGGSKWAVEAPYVIQAAKTLGTNLNFTIIAYAWGDMLTDIIQPFWAIPLLGVAKLNFRDIMGYGLIFFVIYATIISLAFGLVALF